MLATIGTSPRDGAMSLPRASAMANRTTVAIAARSAASQ